MLGATEAFDARVGEGVPVTAPLREAGDLLAEQALERVGHGPPSLDGCGRAGKAVARDIGPSRAKPRSRGCRGFARRATRGYSISAISISRDPLRRPEVRLMVRLDVLRRPRPARAPRPARFVLPRRVLMLARLVVRRRLVVPRVFRPVLLLLRPILRLAICSSL